jgi:hypothetical protein
VGKLVGSFVGNGVGGAVGGFVGSFVGRPVMSLVGLLVGGIVDFPFRHILRPACRHFVRLLVVNEPAWWDATAPDPDLATAAFSSSPTCRAPRLRTARPCCSMISPGRSTLPDVAVVVLLPRAAASGGSCPNTARTSIKAVATRSEQDTIVSCEGVTELDVRDANKNY